MKDNQKLSARISLALVCLLIIASVAVLFLDAFQKSHAQPTVSVRAKSVSFQGKSNCTVQAKTSFPPDPRLKIKEGVYGVPENTMKCPAIDFDFLSLASNVSSTCFLPLLAALPVHKKKYRTVVLALGMFISAGVAYSTTVTEHDVLIWDQSRAAAYEDPRTIYSYLAESMYFIFLGGLIDLALNNILPFISNPHLIDNVKQQWSDAKKWELSRYPFLSKGGN